MEKMWDFVFKQEMRLDSRDYNILVTEALVIGAGTNKKLNREKMTQIMFESFQVKGFYSAFQSVLACYANGKTGGLLIDIGDGKCSTVPIYEGCPIVAATGRN
jgi:actin, other eukaryote